MADDAEIAKRAAAAGKSITAALEITYHLTGRYPQRWKGKRFERPPKGMVVVGTKETVYG
jgi:hypothetical protein